MNIERRDAATLRQTVGRIDRAAHIRSGESIAGHHVMALYTAEKQLKELELAGRVVGRMMARCRAEIANRQDGAA